MSTHLRALAELAAADPYFLGHALARRRVGTGVGDRLLAAALEMDPARLPALRLCRMPAPATWEADIAAIAAYVPCSASRLAEVLRPEREASHA